MDGVLVHGYHAKPELSRHWDERLEADFGIRRDDFRDRFIRTIFEAEVLTGKLGLADALRETLPTIGYSGNPQKLIDYWMQKDSVLTPGILSHIERLSRAAGVRLYIATNQEDVRANYLMKDMQLEKYFSGIFHSARIGVLKPEPEFFARVEALLNCGEHKPTLFDDRESVVEAALAAGWDAHQFDHPDDLGKSHLVASLLGARGSEAGLL